MQSIWNLDGVTVSNIITVDTDPGGTVVLRGVAMQYGEGKVTRVHNWNAMAMPGGWHVEIPGRGSLQGSTFNLGLEVAATINRIA